MYQLPGPAEVKTAMKTFVIDSANCAKAYVRDQCIRRALDAEMGLSLSVGFPVLRHGLPIL